MSEILQFIGAGLLLGWGISHLVPTRNVVRGFGDISEDNQRIITMEWINEGATLIFLGILTGVIILVDGPLDFKRTLFWLIFIMLNAMSVISLFTGYRINFPAFKLCPYIFTTSSLLILFGSYL